MLADVRANSSSDEDISDEAFAARHAVLEAEEQQRFNSFAGEYITSPEYLLLLCKSSMRV